MNESSSSILNSPDQVNQSSKLNSRTFHKNLEEIKINWKKYFFLIIQNWYWFLISFGVLLGIAFFKIRYSIPKYQAVVRLIIEEEENAQDVIGQLRAVRYFRRQADLANEKAKLNSYTVIKRAVDSLNHNLDWTAHGRIRVRPIYRNSRLSISVLSDTIDWIKGKECFIEYKDSVSYRFYIENRIDTIFSYGSIVDLHGWKFNITLSQKDQGYNTYSFIVNDPVQLAKRFKSKLQFEADEKEGTVLTLRSQGTVGELEVDFLNILSNTYILSGLERKQQIAENTFVFIDEQINLILDSLVYAENQLLTFRLSNNVINLSRDGEIAYEQLKTIQSQRTQVNLKKNYYDYLKKYIDNRKDPQTIIAPTVLDDNDQILINAIQELQKLYDQRESLGFSVMNNNPGIQGINERIRLIRLRIIEITSGLIENNLLTLNQLALEEQAILNQLKTLPLNEQQLLNIKRKYDLYNQFYTFLLQKRAEAGIQKASTISNIRILDSARYDDLVPVGNDKKLILIIAILVGILFPSTVLIIRDLLDNRIKERDDIIKGTNIPIAGIIGHSNETSSLPVVIDPGSSFSESVRRIRTNIAFSLRNSKRKVVLITSSISGEGKTFSAANLAAIIAMNNQKVLLIGCDLRKPTLHRVFNISNEVGITSILSGEHSLQDAIHETSINNLFLLPSGPIPPNPAELLETQEMKDILDYATKQYEYVLIDTPPVAVVADGLSFSYIANLTLYIVRQNYSHRDVLQIANSMNSEDKIPNPHILINDMFPSKIFGYNYYYGYGKGYSYGYYKYSNS